MGLLLLCQEQLQLSLQELQKYNKLLRNSTEVSFKVPYTT